MKVERQDLVVEENRRGELRLPSASAATSFFFLGHWPHCACRIPSAASPCAGRRPRSPSSTYCRERPSRPRRRWLTFGPTARCCASATWPGFWRARRWSSGWPKSPRPNGKKSDGTSRCCLMAAGPLRVDHGLAVLATSPGNGGRGRESPLKRRRPKPRKGALLSVPVVTLPWS